MDYFQGVVTEFLRADRSMFVNTECLIQLDEDVLPAKGRHWYCDAVAANFREKSVYLCEVTYSSTVHTLIKRLNAWDSCWPQICVAVARDCHIPEDWSVTPWLFIPQNRHEILTSKLKSIKGIGDGSSCMPQPIVTFLESVTPWNYNNNDRKTHQVHLEMNTSSQPMREIPIELREAFERHFHALIRERAGQLIDEHGVELPALPQRIPFAQRKEWFPVPGMYGGFSYWFEGDGQATKLVTESWSRVVGGSGQRHEITSAGSTLIEKGFV